MPVLTRYQKSQLKEIAKWKKEEPSVASKAFGVAIEPIAWLVRKLVPDSAIRSCLAGANTLGNLLADSTDIKRDGNVKKIEGLKNAKLNLCDRLADDVHNWAIGIAAVEGGGTGVIGILGAPLDIPAIITLALRTIHKIGLCYGFESKTKVDNDFVLSVLAAAGANSMEEKVAALTMLRAIEVTLAKITWKEMTARAAERQLTKEGAIVAIRNLAKQLGINITKRRAMASIPFIGALIGGSVNAWYIKDIGWAARRCYQERWLIECGKLDADDNPSSRQS